MTERMTFDELRSILVDAAGSLEGTDLSRAVIDADVYELGYDSLALLEVAARIKQRFGVAISDDEVPQLRTFRSILGYVNPLIEGNAIEGDAGERVDPRSEP